MVKGQGKVGLLLRGSFQNQSLMMMLSKKAVNTVAVIVALFIDDEDEKLMVQLVIVFSENEVCWMITTGGHLACPSERKR